MSLLFYCQECAAKIVVVPFPMSGLEEAQDGQVAGTTLPPLQTAPPFPYLGRWDEGAAFTFSTLV